MRFSWHSGIPAHYNVVSKEFLWRIPPDAPDAAKN